LLFIATCEMHLILISHLIQIINGVLDGGEIAAETSAAAAAMKVSRHRSVNQPPTTRRHLNDQLVNRLISNTENACMRVATATQPQAGVDLGHAFTATMVVSMTNVQRSDSNGGRTNASLINGYKIRAVNPGAERAEDILCAALVRRQLSRGRSVSDILSASDNDDDILMLSNHDELREHNERENSDRTRARTEEDEDIERSLEEDTSNLILM
jgi:hypothetical protein